MNSADTADAAGTVDQDDARVNDVAGRAYLLLGSPDLAETFAERALAVDPASGTFGGTAALALENERLEAVGVRRREEQRHLSSVTVGENRRPL